MLWWRSVRTYLVAVVRAYQSFVLGLVFGAAGAVALFASDQSGVRVAALIGVALGFVVAPYQAFERMRRERDAARNENQLHGFAAGAGYVNLLSGGNWSIDSFEPPNVPGLIARALIGVPYRVVRDAEISSADMDRFRDIVASSPLAHWFDRNFTDTSNDHGGGWQLVSPCNGFEFTVAHPPVVVAGGGSEASARCMVSLPRAIYGVLPRLFIDVVFRDLPNEAPADGRPPDPFTRFELAGDPYRPSLADLIELLDVVSDTLVDVATDVLKPIVHRTWRERLGERLLRRPLPLVGPNYHVRSKPRYLREALLLPDFPRLGTGYDEIELMVQTPPGAAADDQVVRLTLFRRAIRQILRSQQFRDFESFVDNLGSTQLTAQLAAEEQPAALPRMRGDSSG